jgi:hypothetical protein
MWNAGLQDCFGVRVTHFIFRYAGMSISVSHPFTILQILQNGNYPAQSIGYDAGLCFQQSCKSVEQSCKFERKRPTAVKLANKLRRSNGRDDNTILQV